jgi:hypothetical protein
MSNSDTITLPLLETKEILDPMLKLSQLQTSSKFQTLQTLSKLKWLPIPDGDQLNMMNGYLNMMVLSNGPPTVGPELKVLNNHGMNSSD